MMNENQKAYLDGAAMAYRDCSSLLKRMIDNSPDELKKILQGLSPIVMAMNAKASEVYTEAERFLGERQ